MKDIPLHFQKICMQMSNKHMERSSKSIGVRETQTKTSTHHLIHTGMAINIKKGNSKWWGEYEDIRTLTPAVRNVKYSTQLPWEHYGISLKV